MRKKEQGIDRLKFVLLLIWQPEILGFRKQ